MMNKLLNADKEKAKKFLRNPIGLKQKRIGRPIVSFAAFGVVVFLPNRHTRLQCQFMLNADNFAGAVLAIAH
jgi:hypothetical protein